VDHYAPTHDLAHPWRTRTMIVSAVAAAELVALVAVGVLVLGKGWFQHAQANAAGRRVHHTVVTQTAKHSVPVAKPKPHPAAPATPMLSRAQTTLLVLNGNGQSGAAGAESRVLRAHGYTVSAVGNAKRNDYAASMVMYRPGLKREGLRLARDLGIPIVSALDGIQPSQLKGAKLLVIVGK
jgi:LytR cell envelope-related transcriptional attenuator